MDSFIRLYSLYRSQTRWRVALTVYKKAARKWKSFLWIAKFLFVCFAVGYLIFSAWWLFFLVLMIASACLWAWSFDKARYSAFADQYRLYPERMRYFEREYQYIRYIQFRDKLQNGPYAGSVVDAISFLNEQKETDSHASISAHPIFSFILAAAIAILGGAAGQWQKKYITGTLLFLVFILCLSFMVLGALQTRKTDLKEFKRFLFWARDEQIET